MKNTIFLLLAGLFFSMHAMEQEQKGQKAAAVSTLMHATQQIAAQKSENYTYKKIGKKELDSRMKQIFFDCMLATYPTRTLTEERVKNRHHAFDNEFTLKAGLGDGTVKPSDLDLDETMILPTYGAYQDGKPVGFSMFIHRKKPLDPTMLQIDHLYFDPQHSMQTLTKGFINFAVQQHHQEVKNAPAIKRVFWLTCKDDAYIKEYVSMGCELVEDIGREIDPNKEFVRLEYNVSEKAPKRPSINWDLYWGFDVDDQEYRDFLWTLGKWY